MPMIVDPDNDKQYTDFQREWKSNYTPRNPVKPPSIDSMRVLYQYATSGSIPGDFLLAVLENRLYEAFNLAPSSIIADEYGQLMKISEVDLLNGTVQYITTYLPQEAWGGVDKVANFIKNKKREKNGRKTDTY